MKCVDYVEEAIRRKGGPVSKSEVIKQFKDNYKGGKSFRSKSIAIIMSGALRNPDSIFLKVGSKYTLKSLVKITEPKETISVNNDAKLIALNHAQHIIEAAKKDNFSEQEYKEILRQDLNETIKSNFEPTNLYFVFNGTKITLPDNEKQTQNNLFIHALKECYKFNPEKFKMLNKSTTQVMTDEQRIERGYSFDGSGEVVKIYDYFVYRIMKKSDKKNFIRRVGAACGCKVRFVF